MWREDGLPYVLASEHGMREFAANDRLLTDEFGVKARRIEGHDLPVGMSLSTATGRLVAEMVEGRPTHIDAAPFSPTRF